MHEVLVNRLGGLSLSRKSVVWLTDRPDMTLDVSPGRKTTTATLYLDLQEGPLKRKQYACTCRLTKLRETKHKINGREKEK